MLIYLFDCVTRLACYIINNQFICLIAVETACDTNAGYYKDTTNSECLACAVDCTSCTTKDTDKCTACGNSKFLKRDLDGDDHATEGECIGNILGFLFHE